jgi:hypothetical protein
MADWLALSKTADSLLPHDRQRLAVCMVLPSRTRAGLAPLPAYLLSRTCLSCHLPLLLIEVRDTQQPVGRGTSPCILALSLAPGSTLVCEQSIGCTDDRQRKLITTEAWLCDVMHNKHFCFCTSWP